MEGNSFNVLNATEKFVESDITLLEASYLSTDTVIGDWTIYNIVIMKCKPLGISWMSIVEPWYNFIMFLLSADSKLEASQCSHQVKEYA